MLSVCDRNGYGGGRKAFGKWGVTTSFNHNHCHPPSPPPPHHHQQHQQHHHHLLDHLHHHFRVILSWLSHPPSGLDHQHFYHQKHHWRKFSLLVGRNLFPYLEKNHQSWRPEKKFNFRSSPLGRYWLDSQVRSAWMSWDMCCKMKAEDISSADKGGLGLSSTLNFKPLWYQLARITIWQAKIFFKAKKSSGIHRKSADAMCGRVV